MNTVCFTGRLGRDPEIRYTDNGKTVASFSVAIDSGRDSEPDWVEVTAWDKTAEIISDYGKKGHRVAIEGRLKQDRWEDRATGEKRSKLGVVVNRLDLLTSKAEAEAMAAGGGAAPAPAARRAPAPAPTMIGRRPAYDPTEPPF